MSSLNDEDRANLTAYLDGELDEETAQLLEAKLNQDPAARAEVDELKQAWTMLDYLPRSSPSSSFTHRTMEKLSLEKRPVETGKMPAARRTGWLRPVGWVAAVLVALGGGWFAGQQFWQPAPDPDESLVRHLRIIEKWRAYDLIEDVGFLKALDQPELFGDETGS